MAGAAHAPPQLMVPPQLSATFPQFDPAGQATSFTHAGVPHWFGTPAPPQTVPEAAQFAVPQSKTPPQPSATFPHSVGPHAAFGTHAPPPGPPSEPPPQTLGVPPPPQISGATHPPQSAVTPPQLFGCGPHLPA